MSVSDLISRSGLIEAIKRQYCTGCDNYNGSRCRACHADDMLALVDDAVDAMSRWISVEERLPEGEGWVLAIGLLLKRRSKGNYGWCVPHVAEYRHGRWCDSDGMIPDLENRSLKITHWMPLPEPPKEE